MVRGSGRAATHRASFAPCHAATCCPVYPHLPVIGAKGAKLKEELVRAVKLLRAGLGGAGQVGLSQGVHVAGGAGAGRPPARGTYSRHPGSIQSCPAQQEESLTPHMAHAGARLHSVIGCISHVDVPERVYLHIGWGANRALSCKAVSDPRCLEAVGSVMRVCKPN